MVCLTSLGISTLENIVKSSFLNIASLFANIMEIVSTKISPELFTQKLSKSKNANTVTNMGVAENICRHS